MLFMSKYFIKYQRYFVSFGAFLIFLTIGNYYSFANIEQNVVKYVTNCSNDTSGEKTGNWVFGTIILGMGSSMTLGGYIQMKIGSSLTVLFAGWLLSIIVCLMTFILGTKMWVVIITYGLIGGMATGLAYGVALGAPLKYFPNNKGLILGIVVSGFGLSASIFEPIQSAMYNQTNFNCSHSFANSFFYLGIILGVTQIIGSVLMTKKIYEKAEKTDFNNKDSSESNQSIVFNDINTCDEVSELAPHQIIFELDFWILWIILLLNVICLTFVTSLSKIYWNKIMNDHNSHDFLWISSIGAVFNFLGRIFWGILIDKKPFRIVMLIITLCTSVFVGTFAITTLLSNKFVFGIWYSIMFFLLAGNFTVFPRMIATLFGMKYFTCNYGMLFTSCSVSATIVGIINMIIDEWTRTSCSNMFIIIGVISFLSALVTLVFRGKSLISYPN